MRPITRFDALHRIIFSLDDDSLCDIADLFDIACFDFSIYEAACADQYIGDYIIINYEHVSNQIVKG